MPIRLTRQRQLQHDPGTPGHGHAEQPATVGGSDSGRDPQTMAMCSSAHRRQPRAPRQPRVPAPAAAVGQHRRDRDRQPGAVVADLDQRTTGERTQRNHHVTGAVLDGVANQVGERLSEAQPLAGDEELRRAWKLDSHGTVARPTAPGLGGFAQQLSQVEPVSATAVGICPSANPASPGEVIEGLPSAAELEFEPANPVGRQRAPRLASSTPSEIANKGPRSS